MAAISSVTVMYEGINSVGLFATIASAIGGGWEAVDPSTLLPEFAKDEAIEFVRIETPVETQQEPLATIGLVAEYNGAASSRAYTKDTATPLNVPVFQMLAGVGDTDPHVFYIEYGRTHSRTR